MGESPSFSGHLLPDIFPDPSSKSYRTSPEDESGSLGKIFATNMTYDCTRQGPGQEIHFNRNPPVSLGVPVFGKARHRRSFAWHQVTGAQSHA
jgi:hypothetical protein